MNILRLNDESKKRYIEQLFFILGDEHKNLAAEEMECLVAEKEDKSLGFIAIDFSDDDFPLIDCIYVIPEERYAGIGKALLDAGELMCLISGYESLSFVCHRRQSTNSNIFDYDVGRLINFFENNGYFLTEVKLPPEENLSIIRGNKVFLT